jgi:RNA polymerase sigma-70 factor (ECF subfamily)
MTSRLDSHDLGVHTRYLTAYAMRAVGDRDLAQDLVQDTLVAALSADAGFEGRSALRTWLVGILRHKIMDAYRDRARAPASLDELHDAGIEPEPAADAAAASSFGLDPARGLERKRFWEAFERELGRMPARMAEAFVRSEFSDRPAPDLCREMGITATSLWVMRHRAKNALRTALAPAYAG